MWNRSRLGLLENIVWVSWQHLNGLWYPEASVPANRRTLLFYHFHTRLKETVSITHERSFPLLENFSSNYKNNNYTNVLRLLTNSVSFSDLGCMNTVKHKPGLQLQYLLQGGSYRNTKLRKYNIYIMPLRLL